MSRPAFLGLLSWLFAVGAFAQSASQFERYFLDKTMRVDLYHVGDKNGEFLTIDRILREGVWAGNPASLIDPLNNGRYRVCVYDMPTNALVFTRGYDTYFGEYKTTEPAKNGLKRVFQETILIPYPKHPVLFVVEGRDRQNIYHPLLQSRIDPSDYHVISDAPPRSGRIIQLVKNGDPHKTVDLVFIAEGYTAKEEAKFEADLKRFTEKFFTWEPYRTMKDRFTITGIFNPSLESGTDEPRQGSYRRTLLNATFNSLDSDRYLLTEENKLMRDVAGQVPYDAIVVMVNSKRYGGGGIYNAFTMFTSDGTWDEYVFMHEFGHAFGGLGDEYTGDVSYEDFYPSGVEPTEPNITALLDPENLKWKDLLTPGLSVPTDWGEKAYDSLKTRRSELVAEKAKALSRLKNDSASESAVKEAEANYSRQLDELGKKIRAFMEEHPLKGKIGVFEGAGYVAKGLYRPTLNSLMNQFTKGDRSMYRVNEQAVMRVIDYYTK